MNAAANRRDVFPMPATSPSKRAPNNKPPLTVDEFCRRYAMSRSTFYRMRRRGQTPQEMRVGRKGLITLARASGSAACSRGREKRIDSLSP